MSVIDGFPFLLVIGIFSFLLFVGLIGYFARLLGGILRGNAWRKNK